MITSSNNSLVKKVQLLQRRKRERTKEGVFIVEGIRSLREIPQDWEVERYIIAESSKEIFEKELINKNAQLTYVADNIYKILSDTENPQGAMALVKQKSYKIDGIINKEDGFFIIGDELQDPGNLGTIIRTAHAAGADGVFLSLNCVDLYNPKTIRASMGSIFHIPVIIDVNTRELIERLKKEEINVYAADIRGTNTLYDNDYKEKMAFVIGNEGNGITDEVKSVIDNFISIPMPGRAESLNASVAAGVCMYEVVRQRTS